METQWLEIGKVPSEGWESGLFFQTRHRNQSPGRCPPELAAADLSEISINYEPLLSVFLRNYRVLGKPTPPSIAINTVHTLGRDLSGV